MVIIKKFKQISHIFPYPHGKEQDMPFIYAAVFLRALFFFIYGYLFFSK